MKRNLMILSMLLALVCVGTSLDAQGRKAERQQRREHRRLERSAYDSLRLLRQEADSIYIGYGYIKKKNLTNSVSKVEVNELQVGSYANIGEYLKGRVAGLQVMKVGSGYKYLIRGVGSLNSPTDPLFLVDGIEVRDIDFVNPNDVLTVEVLKDASASIYGNRGANGVIVITTKR